LKLHIISDIHREKESFVDFNLPITNSDAIVMAGDIDNGFEKTSEYLKKISQEHQKPVFYVLGNNCLHGKKIDEERSKWKKADLDGVIYLDDGIKHEFMGYNFTGGLLWPMCQEQTMDEIIEYDKVKLSIPNKTIFKDNGNIMNSFDHITRSKKTIYEIEKILSTSENNIVITHYAPSWETQKRFFPYNSNYGFQANNLDTLINKYDISLWIHGHIHFELDYAVGKTRLYTNPVPPGTGNINSYEKVIELPQIITKNIS